MEPHPYRGGVHYRHVTVRDANEKKEQGRKGEQEDEREQEHEGEREGEGGRYQGNDRGQEVLAFGLVCSLTHDP